MCVHHRSDAVKAETVKLILFHVEAEVAKQETKDFVVIIIEQSAIPQLMATFGAAVEVLVVGAIELIEAVVHILAGVRVNHIKQHSDAHTVSCVDELLQLVRCTCKLKPR